MSAGDRKRTVQNTDRVALAAKRFHRQRRRGRTRFEARFRRRNDRRAPSATPMDAGRPRCGPRSRTSRRALRRDVHGRCGRSPVPVCCRAANGFDRPVGSNPPTVGSPTSRRRCRIFHEWRSSSGRRVFSGCAMPTRPDHPGQRDRVGLESNIGRVTARTSRRRFFGRVEPPVFRQRNDYVRTRKPSVRRVQGVGFGRELSAQGIRLLHVKTVWIATGNEFRPGGVELSNITRGFVPTFSRFMDRAPRASELRDSRGRGLAGVDDADGSLVPSSLMASARHTNLNVALPTLFARETLGGLGASGSAASQLDRRRVHAWCSRACLLTMGSLGDRFGRVTSS